MRCSITIHNVSGKPVGYNYQYGLASMLYKKMAVSNDELALKTHDDIGYKYYTFSNLIFQDRTKCESGLKYTNAKFILSSPNNEFIRSFTDGLLTEPDFFLGGLSKDKVIHTITEINMMPAVRFSNEAVFRTISPVYVKTSRQIGGGLHEYDLSPKDPKFFENIHKNICERYSEYYGEKPESDFFEIFNIENIKQKRILIADSFRRCSLFSFSVQATPEILQFMYEAGIGEKNAMGFGCLDLSGKNVI